MRRKITVIFLSAVLIFGLAFVTDVSRQPENQFLARIYIGSVHIYQASGRPMLEGKVACRFRPTCSDYSIQAVEKRGLIGGLELTFDRLYSCQMSVPMGTIDEVPAE